jgi:hypothetical protein
LPFSEYRQSERSSGDFAIGRVYVDGINGRVLRRFTGKLPDLSLLEMRDVGRGTPDVDGPGGPSYDQRTYSIFFAKRNATPAPSR